MKRMRPLIGLALLLVSIIALACGEEEPTDQASIPATATQVAPTSAPTTTSTPGPSGTPSPTVTPHPTATANPRIPATVVPVDATPVSQTTAPVTLSPTRVPTATLEPTPVASSSTVAPRPAATPRPSATSAPSIIQTTWRGLTIAPESRCSPYDSNAYRYSPPVIGTLYVQRWALGEPLPQRLTVTIEAASVYVTS